MESKISAIMERQSKKMKLVDSNDDDEKIDTEQWQEDSLCKNWQSPYYSYSSSSREPWFLLYGDEGSQCSLLINNQHRMKVFTMEIPELDGGATCLASKDGWLLVFNHGGSVFFLNLFSRTKIDLPKCPFSELSHDSEYIAAFSSAPTTTSKDHCIVAVIKRWQYVGIQLYLHCVGHDEQWVEHECICTLADLSTIRVAVYREGVFHILDGFNGSVTFDCRTKKWRSRVEFSTMRKHDSRVRNCKISRKWFWSSNLREKLGLEEGDVSVSICGTMIPHSDDGLDLLIQNENVEGCESRHVKGVWIQSNQDALNYLRMMMKDV